MNFKTLTQHLIVLGALCLFFIPPGYAASCPEILNHTALRLQDEMPVSLCQYSGKVVLVVNTASKCGYTNQYEGLENLHGTLNKEGLEVLGFPSADFGGQEYEDNKQIADFCHNTYGVKFPMFSKTHVVGANADPLFRELANATGSPPRWNFHKYLIDRSGKVVAAYGSGVTPSDPKLRQAINNALRAKP